MDDARVSTPLPLDWDTDAVAERRRRFLSPSLATFVAYDQPVVWQRGEGQYLWDNHGRRYLDCMAQNVCISVGHAHPGVLAAVREQMEQLPHVTTAYHHPQPGHYAEELIATLPEGPDWVAHFVNSGAEAVDLAVLIARAHTRNYELLALRDAYHGMHYGAQTATGHRPGAPAGAAGAGLRAGDGAAPVHRPLRPRGRAVPRGARADAAHQHLRRRRRHHRGADPGLRRHRRDARGLPARRGRAGARRRRPADRRRGAGRLRAHRRPLLGLRGARRACPTSSSCPRASATASRWRPWSRAARSPRAWRRACSSTPTAPTRPAAPPDAPCCGPSPKRVCRRTRRAWAASSWTDCAGCSRATRGSATSAAAAC